MNTNGHGPEPELPLPSTHDVNLLEVTHGMQPTVEPERQITMTGELVRNEGETDDEFSHRVAVARHRELELTKNLKDSQGASMSPLEKFARVWES